MLCRESHAPGSVIGVFYCGQVGAYAGVQEPICACARPRTPLPRRRLWRGNCSSCASRAATSVACGSSSSAKTVRVRARRGHARPSRVYARVPRGSHACVHCTQFEPLPRSLARAPARCYGSSSIIHIIIACRGAGVCTSHARPCRSLPTLPQTHPHLPHPCRRPLRQQHGSSSARRASPSAAMREDSRHRPASACYKTMSA